MLRRLSPVFPLRIIVFHSHVGWVIIRIAPSRVFRDSGGIDMTAEEPKKIKVRRMAASDVKPTLAIWWADIPEKNKVASELESPLDMSFLAEYEGILVGFILAKQEYVGYPMTAAGVIYLIAVNPEYRRHGIGTMMIQALEKLCKTKDIKTIRAPVPRDDAAITRYFAEVGFHPSDIINYDLVDFNRG
jgi:ribosomal protein S18 acetylase RimI-like enzyme